MKNLLLGFMATLLFANLGYSNGGEKTPVKPIILTTYEPGSFSAGIFGCWGSGVCRRDIVVQGRVAPKTTEVTNNLDGTLTMKFVYKTMSTENQAYYTDRSSYVVDQEFLFNKEEAAALGLKDGASIKAGTYKAAIVKDCLVVTVRL